MPLYFALLTLFVFGAVVGGFLNKCISRVPLEKSVLWPTSRCGTCLQPIRWYDNLPLLSYWLLRGRCRTCGAPFSMRYFVIELLTGLCFAGLFYVEVVDNIHRLAIFDDIKADVREHQDSAIDLSLIPPAGWAFYGYHALLICFLLVSSFADIDYLEIPLTITFTGTAVGLVGGALLWPWLPAHVELVRLFGGMGPLNLRESPGVYPWPVWGDVPRWLLANSWLMGLATGLAGMLAGMLVLRAVRFVFGLGRGVEGLGVGDADLMMMAGSFIGWQPIVIAFFVSVAPALVFGILQLAFKGNQMLPFGPSLALGVAITMLCWASIGHRFAEIFFTGSVLLTLGGGGLVMLFVISFLLRLIRPGPAV
jgi:leader peptidase (prepilin peptidase)/N-methyltransferase